MNQIEKVVTVFLILFFGLAAFVWSYSMAIRKFSPKREGGKVSPAFDARPTNRTASQPSNFVVMDVTAYCPCEKCCGIWATKGVNRNGQRITASGHVIKPRDKFIAAPRKYPFGTIMDVPGYGLVPVLDRGGTIEGNKLDVFFPKHQEALNWGRQYLKVRILE